MSVIHKEVFFINRKAVVEATRDPNLLLKAKLTQFNQEFVQMVCETQQRLNRRKNDE